MADPLQDLMFRPPQNPVTPTLQQLMSGAQTAGNVGHAAFVQPVQEMGRGLSDLMSGQGVTPDVGAGLFSAMGLFSPGSRLGRMFMGARAAETAQPSASQRALITAEDMRRGMGVQASDAGGQQTDKALGAIGDALKLAPSGPVDYSLRLKDALHANAGAGFPAVFEEIKSLPVEQIKSIAKEFVGITPTSGKDALSKIWARHQNLEGHRMKERFVGGRSAG